MEEFDAFTACDFEDDLRAHNALYYEQPDKTRIPASAGAYMSIVDFLLMEKVLETYPDEKVDWLEEYYQSFRYLSPGFGLIQIGIKYYKRRTRNGTDQSNPTGRDDSGENQ